MGREATCPCRYGDLSGEVKALLESGELILRGTFRKRIPIPAMERPHVVGTHLCLHVDGLEVSLDLGAQQAARWLAAIRKPPPTLAHRLGITPSTRIRVLGEIECTQLHEALAQAECTEQNPDLLLVAPSSLADLSHALRQSEAARANNVAIWVVYRKGPKQEVNESAVRAVLRDIGMIDTKVTAISATHTALRFLQARRKPIRTSTSPQT